MFIGLERLPQCLDHNGADRIGIRGGRGTAILEISTPGRGNGPRNTNTRVSSPDAIREFAEGGGLVRTREARLVALAVAREVDGVAGGEMGHQAVDDGETETVRRFARDGGADIRVESRTVESGVRLRGEVGLATVIREDAITEIAEHHEIITGTEGGTEHLDLCLGWSDFEVPAGDAETNATGRRYNLFCELTDFAADRAIKRALFGGVHHLGSGCVTDGLNEKLLFESEPGSGRLRADCGKVGSITTTGGRAIKEDGLAENVCIG